VVVMGDERQPGRRFRPDDAQALEEIRKLFARYREIARKEERDELPESRAKTFAARVRDSRDAPVPTRR
jgi:hypothetical protein